MFFIMQVMVSHTKCTMDLCNVPCKRTIRGASGYTLLLQQFPELIRFQLTISTAAQFVSLQYTIDVIPHVTKCQMDSGRKVAILSGKYDRGLWSASTAEQFASSFLTSAESDFTFPPRMHKVSTRHKAHRSK